MVKTNGLIADRQKKTGTACIAACAKAGQLQICWNLLDSMEDNAISPDAAAFGAVLWIVQMSGVTKHKGGTCAGLPIGWIVLVIWWFTFRSLFGNGLIRSDLLVFQRSDSYGS
jgi:pentatricopeptide repeat protein